MSDQFVHLHTHTHYSLLDGAIKIPNLVKAAREFGMPAIGITDHGNMFGALEFFQACKKEGIKPIIGYEAYVAPNSRFDKNRENARAFHLTLLAKNYTGYKNLMKLASEAYLNGFYYKPRIDRELLAQHSEGIIAFSGCLASEICRNILAKDIKKARKVTGWYQDLFGDDFYVELQKNKIKEQYVANDELLKISKDFKLPLVYTNDIHYLRAEDAKPHDVLLCIQTGNLVKKADRFRFGSQEFYMKSPQQMRKEAEEFPGAADNTLLIAEKVDLDIPLGEIHLPKFDTPGNIPNEEYLRQLCEEGLRKRYGEIKGEVKERFEREFDVICKMGFASYFLIVWDFINYARQKEIPVGPGRGSAAGSIIAYALMITDLDPLKYRLIFERFLNEGRNEMPDIDIDFETERRGEVIEYVSNKYGKKQVAQIITFGTMAARAVIRDVGRAMDIPLPVVDKVAKKVPPVPKMTIAKALKEEEDFRKVYKEDRTITELVDIAKNLEGLNRQPGLHAAGVIIADADLTEYCPLYKSSDGTIATQYSMKYLENLGLLKMDFLGLSTLTLIDKALKIIQTNTGTEIDISKIPLDNKETYELLMRGDTGGVFQLESDGMRNLVKRLRPDRFEDIIALVALYRPGPLQSGMVDTYIRCKHGEEHPVYKHPILEQILSETFGMILYQEQAMEIAKEMALFSLSEADKLRKAMGKKIKELMDSYREKFIEGAAQQDISEELAVEVYSQIEYFSGYGFNKSHSAAYALVTYQTAYLKALYPKEFMCALMTCENQNTEKIVRYMSECGSMNIEVLPPDINQSRSYFCVEEGDKIRFGLSAIKGVGDKAVESMMETRDGIGSFKSLVDLCENVDTRVANKQTLEALVKSGSFDCFNRSRSQMFAGIPEILKLGANIQKQKNSNQMDLFGDFAAEEVDEVADADDLYPEVDAWTEIEKLKFEKQTLGFYFSGHPLQKWSDYITMMCGKTIDYLYKEKNVGASLLGGMISAKREITIKSGRNQGRKMAQVHLEDLTASCSMICFPDTYQKYSEYLQEDQAVFVRGKMNEQKDDPEIIIDQVIPIEQGLESLVTRITLKIKDKTEDDVRKLFEVCSKYRGDCKTFIHVEGKDFTTDLEVAEKYFLRPSAELFQEIEKVVGKGAIMVM
ncbi:DNA polymerase III subunit alpha [Candidatus Uabimicrobium amorphum]|uniref:DNA polymerase III subunit alpha n=1 Tax=Uabimicrobium amorphum TaxID=2596890 RepID=A0A5S9F4V3_UABAM|nr:DNA polymerase III subunit alpha [Candidatus Uabimicrobium amorphum]BBM85503.1 DNA-directed DNA polymerase [Candidatus Uabimicrobium amorphum]